MKYNPARQIAAPRTIQRDIEFMRDSLNAPIESGRQGYRYSEPNFFIKSIPLSEGEAFAITVMTPCSNSTATPRWKSSCAPCSPRSPPACPTGSPWTPPS